MLLRLSLIQQLLVPLQALRRSPANNGCYCTPLRGHKLREVKELLILRLGPFCLLDRGVEPFVPPGLALFGGFPDKQRGDARPERGELSMLRIKWTGHSPLVLPVLRDGGLQDLILGVL